MDAPTAGHPQALSLGALVVEGKTKKIFRINGSDLVSVVAKDDITAGDGAKHDVIPDKGALATQTTCNVFRLLKACGLPIAFETQNSATSFIAPPCTMLPYEVVVRREAHGSALKRSPHFSKGQLFPKLLVEFYLKTKDKDWKGKPLVADDPYMQYEDGGAQIKLFNPAKPIIGAEPFLTLPTADVFSHPEEYKFFPEMRRIARQAFMVLERAWALEGGTLVDYKVEFGFDAKGTLLLADVIDNNSWRVLENGAYIDKQVYRDGGTLDTVAAKYSHLRVGDVVAGAALRPRHGGVVFPRSLLRCASLLPAAQSSSTARLSFPSPALRGRVGEGEAVATLAPLARVLCDTAAPPSPTLPAKREQTGCTDFAHEMIEI